MVLHSLFFVVCLLFAVEAAPTKTQNNLVKRACTTTGVRKSWHNFSNDEKLAYINAELCLMKGKSKLGLPGAVTRYDDLHAIHQQQAYKVHFVGAFLPFHRYYIYAHEQALRNECNYTGYQPYWDETKDAGKFSSSIILDKTYGFGGDGSGSGHCIKDGPFKDYVNRLGPAYSVTNHCIDRQISNSFSSSSSQSAVNQCLNAKDFATAWPCIENQPHGGGHGGIGGQMLNGVSSPGDPLFWLHHTFLDKIWWDWQVKSSSRFTEINGNNIMGNTAFFPARPSSIPAPTSAPGDPGKVTTLNHVLSLSGEMPDRPISDVMDPQTFMCYSYAAA